MRRSVALLLVVLARATSAEERDLEVDVGDATIHVHEVGAPTARDVLLVIHGGPGLTHEYMLPLARLATEGRRVVFYDQRGSGASPRPQDRQYGLPSQVADVEAVRMAVGAERVVLIGHSWGTVVALAYAIEHGDVVRSVVLLGMGAPTASEDSRTFGAAFSARRRSLEHAGLVPKTRPPPDGDDCMGSFVASLPAHFADARHPGARHLAGTYHCDVSRATLRAAGAWDFRSDLEAFQLPILLVIGDADSNYKGWIDTMKLLPREVAVRGVLQSCGHFPWIECPEPFFGMIERFVGR